MMSREITPPPSKRRKISTDDLIDDRVTIPKSKEPHPPADLDAVRVYSWNISGINPFLQTSITSFFSSPTISKAHSAAPPASLRDFLRRHHWPQILCLQEIKIASSDTKISNALRQAVNGSSSTLGNDNREPTYEVFTTLPSDKFNARGLGGKGRIYGVASIIRTDFYREYVADVRTVDWDSEGRFSIIEVQDPRTSFKLSIWNVYAVNGTTNEYRDPRTGEVVGTRHNRKLAVHGLMMDESRSLEQKGWNVLIIGDLNVAPARIDGHPNLRISPHQHVVNRSDFNHRFLDAQNTDGFRGVDVWRALRGEERKYTYYPRNRIWGSSCDRVDLAVVSRGMIGCERGGIVGCEIWDTEMERGPSDHCPISVDIQMQRGHGKVGERGDPG